MRIRSVVAFLVVFVAATGVSGAERKLSLQVSPPRVQEGQQIEISVTSQATSDTIRLTWVDGFGDIFFTTTASSGMGRAGRATLQARMPLTPVNFITAQGRHNTARAIFTILPRADTFWQGFAIVADEPPEPSPQAALVARSLGIRAALAEGERGCVLSAEAALRPIPRGLVSPGGLSLSAESFFAAVTAYKTVGDAISLSRDPSLADPRLINRLGLEAARQVALLRNYAPAGYLPVEDPSVTRGNAVLDLSFSQADIDGFRSFVSNRYDSLESLSRSWGEGTDLKSLAEVMPKTADDMATGLIEAFALPVDLAPWALHREYMDSALALSIARLSRTTSSAAAAPGPGDFNWSSMKTPSGISGALGPSAYGGWDWQRLRGTSDFIILDRSTPEWAWALVADLNPSSRVLARVNASSRPDVERTWRAISEGLRGVVLDNCADLIAKSAAPGAKEAGAARSSVAHILSGIRGVADHTALSRKRSRVALVYSPASVRAGWMIAQLSQPGRPVAPEAGTEGLSAWSELLDEIGVDYAWITLKQVEQGALSTRLYRVVILPEAWCLSKRAVQELGFFASSGGVVMADHSAGLLDGNYRAWQESPADKLFAISRRTLTYEIADDIILSAAFSDEGLRMADAELKAAGGAKPRKSGGVLEVTRSMGSGGTIYLNLMVRDWHQATPETRKLLSTTVWQALEVAGYSPRLLARVEGKLINARVRSFEGAGSIVYFIDPLGVEKSWRKGTVEIRFPQQAYTYNLRPAAREGEPLGLVDRVIVKAPANGPLVLARSASPPTGLTVEIEWDGAAIYVRATVDSEMPVAERFLMVQAFNPAGGEVPQLEQFAVAPNGRAQLTMPVPLNAPRGTWRILVRDLATGMASWGNVAVR